MLELTIYLSEFHVLNSMSKIISSHMNWSDYILTLTYWVRVWTRKNVCVFFSMSVGIFIVYIHVGINGHQKISMDINEKRLSVCCLSVWLCVCDSNFSESIGRITTKLSLSLCNKLLSCTLQNCEGKTFWWRHMRKNQSLYKYRKNKREYIPIFTHTKIRKLIF